MTRRPRFALGGAGAVLLCACDAPVAPDPAAPPAASSTANSPEAATPPLEPRRAHDQPRASTKAPQEPSMTEPQPKTAPPPARPVRAPSPRPVPVPTPRPVILPAPTQPPAEIDPVQPYPGDEVPR